MHGMSDDKKSLDEALAGVKDLTPERIEELIKNPRRRLKNFVDPPPPPLQEGICVVCSGKIIEERQTHIRGEPVYGGRNSTYTTSKLSCTSCGIMYKHLPKTADQK